MRHRLDAIITTACAAGVLLPVAPMAQEDSMNQAHGDATYVPWADTEASFNFWWADHAFSETTDAVAQDNIAIVHEDVAGDTKVGRCAFGGPIRLGERVYTRGIGVNSHSVLRVSLTQPAERFVADIGLDRNVDGTPASVAFHVRVDERDVFATGVMRPLDGVRSIDVPLKGAQTFELIVDDGGDGRGWDQGDWADARTVLTDGSELWLDDLARRWQVSTHLPFSFVYDGRHSSEFIDEWACQVHDEVIDAAKRHKTLTLSSPDTGLEVRVICTVYTDTPGVDWTLYFTNTGEKDTPFLESIQALDIQIAPGIGVAPVLRRVRGSSCSVDDWLPFDEPAPSGGRVEFAPVEGKSSRVVSPFFNLDWQTGGVITAIGWSGQWAASIDRAADGSLRLEAGMQKIRLKLRPGETIRSPRIMQLYWFGKDHIRASNLFRRTMLSHVMPKKDGRPLLPPIVHLSTSFYELNESTEANVLSHLYAIRGLGFEFFWLDAYWTRDGFPNGMGHYGFPIQRAEPKDRFPNGIRPISNAAHEEGLGFVLWFEPERVASGTELAREHPEWVISPAGDGSGLLNLGIPEAREYMTKYLVTVVNEYGIDCLRIDFNIDPLPFWRLLDEAAPDRAGMAEIRYVEGQYRMWDDILRACPHLFIDNCASGGMRIDLETCSRSIPLWRTDATIAPLMAHDFNEAAMRNQVITAGLSRYVPFSTSGMMGATPYWFRSGVNGGGIAFCEDCRPEDYPRELLKQAIAEAKRIRKYYFGDFYPLSEITTSARDWCVMQYHRLGEQDGMIIAFRRHESPYGSFVCDLHEIRAEAQYEMTRFLNYQPSEPVTIRGAELSQIKLEIDERPGSLIVEYRRFY